MGVPAIDVNVKPTEVFVEPSSYTVSVMPLDSPWQPYIYHFNMTIEFVGQMPGSKIPPGRVWAVRRMSECLARSGKWDYEPMPSGRSDAFIKSHRFTLDEAIAAARKAAPKIVVNGSSVEDAMRYTAERGGPL